MTPRPPALGRWLLKLTPLKQHRADIEADLADLFASRLAERGAGYAKRRYLVDVLSLWRHGQPVVEGEGMTRLGGRRWRPLEGVTDDVRFAFRLFRRQAGTVSVAVAGLATAIALATIVFSVFNTFNLRPLGVADPDAVVVVHKYDFKAGRTVSLTPPEYNSLRDSLRLLKLEASVALAPDIGQPGEVGTPPANVRFVSGTLVKTFGGRTILGRAIDVSDDWPGAPLVTTLHHAYWTRRFNADPAVVGRTILVAGVPVTIVGVFDRSFTGPFRAVSATAALLPMSALASLAPTRNANGYRPLDVVGALARPATAAQAESEASGVLRGLGLVPPDPGAETGSPVRVRTVREQVTDDDLVMLSVFLTIIGLVLLLAATNVANLLLASATTRYQEIGARLALGANRGRIVRQLLTESVLLGSLAGVAALLLTAWFTPIAASLVQIPPEVDFRTDWRVAAFVAVLSTLAGVVAGLAPARFGAAGDVLASLKGGGARAGGAPRAARTRSIFLGVQAGVSIVLLILTSLSVRALVQVSTTSPDFDVDRFVNLFAARAAGGRVPDDQFWTLALERVRSLPGVEAAGLAQTLPFMGSFKNARPERNAPGLAVEWNEVSPGYFGVIGYRVARGRLYTADESAVRAPVAVITSNVAQAYWPNEEAIGSSLERVAGAKFRDVRVIGIVIDPAPRAIPQREAGAGIIFRPIADWTATRMAVRIAEGPTLQALRSAVTAIDPARNPQLQFIRDMRDRQLLVPRALAAIGSVFGGLALLLAIIGVVGVTAFVVAQRRREIGIRMAIGATRADVIRSVLVQGMRPIGIGLVTGTAVAFLAAPLVREVMYGGISERDPLAFGAAAAVLLASALCGMLVPARRASRTDPASVLKEQ
jgi:predicted permease